jgi:hypothetical protein
MAEPVEQSRGHSGIAKDNWLLTEGEVRRDDDGSLPSASAI